MLSSGMLTPSFFIFPGNFTHSYGGEGGHGVRINKKMTPFSCRWNCSFIPICGSGFLPSLPLSLCSLCMAGRCYAYFRKQGKGGSRLLVSIRSLLASWNNVIIIYFSKREYCFFLAFFHRYIPVKNKTKLSVAKKQRRTRKLFLNPANLN